MEEEKGKEKKPERPTIYTPGRTPSEWSCGSTLTELTDSDDEDGMKVDVTKNPAPTPSPQRSLRPGSITREATIISIPTSSTDVDESVDPVFRPHKSRGYPDATYNHFETPSGQRGFHVKFIPDDHANAQAEAARRQLEVRERQFTDLFVKAGCTYEDIIAMVTSEGFKRAFYGNGERMPQIIFPASPQISHFHSEQTDSGNVFRGDTEVLNPSETPTAANTMIIPAFGVRACDVVPLGYSCSNPRLGPTGTELVF
jgi:hypothetical protein